MVKRSPQTVFKKASKTTISNVKGKRFKWKEIGKLDCYYYYDHYVEKARKNGENLTSFRGIAFVASDMGWP